ncbi:MAG TPA: hypothetical protein VG842_09810 [Sediminibacterium sp.]|jgi:hypothetical protein|nr:hypothetical protein [Chitinophagaceae bacterium]HVZ26340.1 hypothetical protein [Sediminibacterium sp.]
MRRFILLICLFSYAGAFGQWKSYIIGVKGDTLNCVDLQGKKQGRWVEHYDELRGEPGFEAEGVYENGKKEGVWRKYSLMGDLIAVENYRWGNKDGKNVYFNNTGQLLREESWKAVNPDNPYDTVDVYDIHDPTKVIERRLVKLQGYSLKHGTWTYYDPLTGKVDKTERWWLDKPAAGSDDDELKPLDISSTASQSKSDSTTAKKMAKPQVVLDYEKKNGKKKIKVRDGRTGY